MKNIIVEDKALDIKKWIKTEISNHWEVFNGKIDISPVSYDDYISETFLMSAINNYENSYEKKDGLPFSAYLYDVVFDEYLFERLIDIEDNIKYSLLEKAAKISNELYDVIDEIPSGELIEDIGGIDISLDISDFLDHTYKLNFILATETELNYDMGMIQYEFDSPADFVLRHKDRLADSADNMLNFLIRQQGYEVSDVLAEYRSDNREMNSEFVRSVISELEEDIDYGMSALTICVASSGKELLDVLDNLLSKDPNKGIEVKACTSMGLYDYWNGCGSQIDVIIEKPFIVPSDMVHNIQLEKAGKNNNGYTVDETYGMVGTVWNCGKIEATDIEEKINRLRKPSKDEVENIVKIYFDENEK